MSFDGEGTQQSSRLRLLEAGKALFSQHGFEQTSTAMIAREAGTSESQLVRYYKSKAGLLEAIFNHGWQSLNHQIQSIIGEATNAHEALLGVMASMTGAFASDHNLAFLLLFEGRRVRGGTDEIVLSDGFLEFSTLLSKLISRGKRDGTFPSHYNEVAVATAIMGSAEAMIRERLIAERSGKPDPFTDEQIAAVFSAMLDGLAIHNR